MTAPTQCNKFKEKLKIKYLKIFLKYDIIFIEIKKGNDLMNTNQKIVYEVLCNNKKYNPKYGGWLQIKNIKEFCGFEKAGTVTGCLMGLKKIGLVESEEQELLDGTILRFFRAAEQEK